MNCEEVKIGLNHFFDESLDDNTQTEIDEHIRKCPHCFEEYKKLRKFFNKLKDLELSIDPPANIIDEITKNLHSKTSKENEPNEVESEIDRLKRINKEKLKQEQLLKTSRLEAHKKMLDDKKGYSTIYYSTTNRQKQNKTLLFLFGFIIMSIGIGYGYFQFQRENSPWKIKSESGIYLIDGKESTSAKFNVDNSLNTKNDSRVIINVPKTGTIRLEPNSSIKLLTARSGDNVISFKSGSLKIVTNSDLPDFKIKFTNFDLIDYGASYTVAFDDFNNINLVVEFGYVGLRKNDSEIFINENYSCKIINRKLVSTPFRTDAPLEFIDLVLSYEKTKNTAELLDKISNKARPEDALTLLELLKKVSAVDRQILFQSISNFFPPPIGVTRNGIMRLEPDMLQMWWEEIEWQI
ncbi:MAG: hypothetical protein M0P71_02940 [Melioribacteraceae bacterium]|nr:hypothetical protein [Melioribacteraceae bacterium]